MLTISNRFDLGEFVYVVHEPKCRRMIVSVEIYLDKSYLYKVAGDGKNEYCQERELLKESEKTETILD